MKNTIIIFLLCIAVDCFSQKKESAFAAAENNLSLLRDSTIKAENDSIRIAYNNRFTDVFEQALLLPESFEYSFGKLQNIGVLPSPDNKIRLINWNLPMDDGTHVYYCYLQYLPKKGEYKLFKLNDKSADIQGPEYKSLDDKKWFGVLYYEIIPVKEKKNTWYTLLGWDGNDRVTTKKIIDVLYFDNSGKPKFGDDVFELPKVRKKRIVFEFSAEVVMSLKYHPQKNMIIFDNLSPLNPGLEGQKQFYGPDMTYDALVWEKGKWVYKQDIDVRNNDSRIYNPEPDSTEKGIYVRPK
jgi:hypothetical protein